jgi:hypothetical protein
VCARNRIARAFQSFGSCEYEEMSDVVPFPVSLNLPTEFFKHHHIRPRDTEGGRMCGAIRSLGII